MACFRSGAAGALPDTLAQKAVPVFAQFPSNGGGSLVTALLLLLGASVRTGFLPRGVAVDRRSRLRSSFRTGGRIPFDWRSEAESICAADFLTASRIRMYKANETAPEIRNVFQRCIFVRCWCLTPPPSESGRRAWQHGSMSGRRAWRHG